MGNNPDVSELGFDELRKVVDEYRKKISQIVQEEEGKYRQQANQKSGEIVDAAWRKAESIIADSQQKAQQAADEIKDKANAEATRLVSEAKIAAEQLLKEADNQVKKEAKNRVKKEIEKIIEEAKKESQDIILQVRRTAEKEAAEIVGRAKRESDQIAREAREGVAKEARWEAARVIAEAQKKAEKVAAEAVARSEEINRSLVESVQKAEGIIQRFRQELQAELDESSRLVGEVANNLKNTAVIAAKEQEAEARSGVTTPARTNGNGDAKAVDFECEVRASKVGDGKGEMYAGAMELKVVSSYDLERIVEWKDFLAKIPNFRFVSEMGYENGLVIKFSIVEPVPLLNVLKTMPLVESVVTDGDVIKLMLEPPSIDFSKVASNIN